MPNYSLQIGIWPTSNLAEDVCTNTWSCAADTDADASDFATAVIAFHTSLVSWYPDIVRQNGHTYKIYDRSDAIPRVPVEEGTFNMPSAPGSVGLPTEVALCVSFQGVPESGVSQARKRGRIYFGPIDASANSTGARPTSTIIDALVAAADTLLTASDAAGAWTWTVYSATTGDSFPVANGWVDNEWDVQRRRGRLATARTVYP